jgi:TonB family protein
MKNNGFWRGRLSYASSGQGLRSIFSVDINARVPAMKFLVSFSIGLLAPLSVHAQDNQADSSRESARLQPLIQQQWDEYKKRPRRLFLNRKNNMPIVENYAAECFRKIQTVGNLNYPREAMGKIYGNVILSFEVMPDGVFQSISVVRSSGHDVLDKHAIYAVELASPCQPYPMELKERADSITLTRMFSYTNETIGSEPNERYQP